MKMFNNEILKISRHWQYLNQARGNLWLGEGGPEATAQTPRFLQCCQKQA